MSSPSPSKDTARQKVTLTLDLPDARSLLYAGSREGDFLVNDHPALAALRKALDAPQVEARTEYLSQLLLDLLTSDEVVEAAEAAESALYDSGEMVQTDEVVTAVLKAAATTLMGDLHSFIAESNRIEGIHGVTNYEVEAHELFLALPHIRVADLENFVKEVAAAPLRNREGMNVRVGNHRPEPGGRGIELGLQELLVDAHSPALNPWQVHVAYEQLHPFMDGNGRSGRVLWAWMRLREDRDPFALGFLHSAYYEALEAGRRR